MLRRTLAAFSLVALPGAALAEPMPSGGGECGSDSDCPTGFACEVTGGSACACEPNVPCDCAPVEYRSCVPGPCGSDADCGEGMVCATYEEPCAVAVPCPSDGECPPPPPCEPTARSVCAPRWVLPCEAAADCGEGFDCEPIEMCECSGGAPVPTDPGTPDAGGGSDGSSGSGSGDASDTPSGSESPAPPDESSCTCAPSEESWCRAVEIVCEDASVCPSGWTCERWVTATDCAAPAPDGEGEREDVPCEPSEPQPATTGLCVPPFGVAFDTGIPRGDDAASAPQYESGTASPTDGAPLPTPTPGNAAADVDEGGCQGGAALPIAGLGLLVVALWRRRVATL